jgi:hypothetical protein
MTSKPKLFRSQLTELFRENGLPPLSLSYLNKIHCLGDGPPVAMIWNRRPLYDPDEALAWLHLKVAEQMKTALARAEATRRFHRERAEFRRRSGELAA